MQALRAKFGRTSSVQCGGTLRQESTASNRREKPLFRFVVETSTRLNHPGRRRRGDGLACEWERQELCWRLPVFRWLGSTRIGKKEVAAFFHRGNDGQIERVIARLIRPKVARPLAQHSTVVVSSEEHVLLRPLKVSSERGGNPPTTAFRRNRRSGPGRTRIFY